MKTLQLKTEEAALLSEVLNNCLSELRMEVANTDSMEFRDKLKDQEKFLKRLLETLET